MMTTGAITPFRVHANSAATTIPRPSVFGAMWMLLAIAVVNVIVGAAIRIVIGTAEGPFDDLTILGRLASLLVGFVVTAGLLASMLPTTFRRGCLVTLFAYLIGLAIAALVFTPLYVLGLQLTSVVAEHEDWRLVRTPE